MKAFILKPAYWRTLQIVLLTDSKLVARSVNSTIDWVGGLVLLLAGVYLGYETILRTSHRGWDGIAMTVTALSAMGIGLGLWFLWQTVLQSVFTADLLIEDGAAVVSLRGLGRSFVTKCERLKVSIVIDNQFRARGIRFEYENAGVRTIVAVDGSDVDENNGLLSARLSRLTGVPTTIRVVGSGSIVADN